MKGDLGGVEETQRLDQVSGHIPTDKRQSQAVQTLQRHQRQLKSQQSHATLYHQPNARQCGVTAGGREGITQSWSTVKQIFQSSTTATQT
ncbi:hypothetical protein DPMN_159534 [Dreissena polymorpha]|uniref:Uncharacterized protein n=1 Tax=Dreissena polymorpha TaxID=45954 RepID=A0A9D4ELL2_DREPO|nr:hypothetical protein DPMN_159534 [Dreissena polymorpha]